MSDCSWPHGRQKVRLPCPSPSPRVCPSSRSLHQWCHSAISSSDALLSFYPQSFPTSGSFLLSQVLASGDQNIEASASASVLPVSIQGWFSLRLTSLISLLSKGLSRVFSRTTVRRHEFFGALLRSIGRREAPKAPKRTSPGRNGEFGLITQAQLQHQVDGERTVEDTEMTEAANCSRHSPSCTDIPLWGHLVEHVSVNLKKKRYLQYGADLAEKGHPWSTGQGHFRMFRSIFSSEATGGLKMNHGNQKLAPISRLNRHFSSLPIYSLNWTSSQMLKKLWEWGQVSSRARNINFLQQKRRGGSSASLEKLSERQVALFVSQGCDEGKASLVVNIQSWVTYSDNGQDDY